MKIIFSIVVKQLFNNFTASNHHNSNISLNNDQQKTQIVNPLAGNNNNTLPMSPMPNQLQMSQMNQSGFNQGTNNSSISSMTDSQHSVSTGPHSNSSESSVIYRPSSESGSDAFSMQKNPIPNRKIDHFAEMTNGHGINQMNQINGNGNVAKFNTIPSKLATTTTNNIMQSNPTIFEDDKQMQVLAMRPLFRGFNGNNCTLPSRGTRGQHMVNDFCDENGQQGYCSDGDALRNISVRYSDIENGYLSEGGNMTTSSHLMSMFRNRSHLPTTIEEK